MKSGLFAFDQATTVGPGTITNAMLANMAARTVKVNATNASASPQDLQGTVALSYLRVNAATNGLEWGTLPVDPGLVTSVFTRTGAVVAVAGDYTAAQVTNVPAGNIAAVTVQAAIAELDVEKAGLALANVFTAAQTVAVTSSTITVETLQLNDDGAFGPRLVFRHNSASPAVSDAIMLQDFNANNASAVDTVYARLACSVASPTAGAESGEITMATRRAGAFAVRWALGLGLTLGVATGGDQGAGTINAVNYFDDGVNINALYAGLANTNVFTNVNMFGGVTYPATFADGGYNRFYSGSGVDFAFGKPNATQLDIYANGATVVSFRNDGVVFGAASGGSPAAAGAVNVTSYYTNGALAVDTNNTHFIASFTVATLPTATANRRATITDGAAVPVFGAVVAGAGALRLPVFADGTNWRNG